MAETPSIIVEAEQILEATGSSAVSTARQSAARSRTPAAAASVPWFSRRRRKAFRTGGAPMRAVAASLALLAAAVLVPTSASAQEGAIAGRVLDVAGDPLPGVTVEVLGSAQGETRLEAAARSIRRCVQVARVAASG